MSMSQAIPFNDVVEAADQLSLEEHPALVHILQRRMALAQRQQLAAEIAEARQEFAEGKCRPATAEEMMREIMT